MTVARLMDEMTSSELVKWLGYFKVKSDMEEKRREERKVSDEVEAGLRKERTKKLGGGRR